MSEAHAPEAPAPEAPAPEAPAPEAPAPEAPAPEAPAPDARKPRARKPRARKPRARKPKATKPEATKPEATKTPATITPAHGWKSLDNAREHVKRSEGVRLGNTRVAKGTYRASTGLTYKGVNKLGVWNIELTIALRKQLDGKKVPTCKELDTRIGKWLAKQHQSGTRRAHSQGARKYCYGYFNRRSKGLGPVDLTTPDWSAVKGQPFDLGKSGLYGSSKASKGNETQVVPSRLLLSLA